MGRDESGRVPTDGFVSPLTRPSPAEHESLPTWITNLRISNQIPVALRLLFVWRNGGQIMETMLQFLVIVGGLTFSVATAVLIEELIFGRLFSVAFARRAEVSKPGQDR